MDSQSESPRPQSVTTAVNLLWTSLAVGLVKITMDFSHLASLGSAAIALGTFLAVFAVMSLLIFKIAAGRNWARISFVVFFVLGVLPAVPIVIDEFGRSGLLGLLSVLQTGLQLYALWLIFSQPGKAWFKKAVAA